MTTVGSMYRVNTQVKTDSIQRAEMGRTTKVGRTTKMGPTIGVLMFHHRIAAGVVAARHEKSTGGISRDMKMTPAEPQDKAAGGSAYQAVRMPFPCTLLESHMLMDCYLSADRVAHQAGRG